VSEKTPLISRLTLDGELPKCGQIHSHKGEESAEIQQFPGMLISASNVVEYDGTDKRESANKKNVVGWRAAARLQVAEKFTRQHAIAPHTKEQASCAESACQPASERRHDQNCAHGIEENQTTHTAADVHKGGLKIRK